LTYSSVELHFIAGRESTLDHSIITASFLGLEQIGDRARFEKSSKLLTLILK
jgi:hypothetical protein